MGIESYRSIDVDVFKDILQNDIEELISIIKKKELTLQIIMIPG
ncbi:MAG: hypothetical protein PHW82_10960 [Bacteroidales bacterium]|nr:hypothetical protein [Bacteroidales bacterium]